MFAVPVELVLEILDMRPLFRVPEAPAHLAGLIDVRGQAVPVIDLRLKLGLAAASGDREYAHPGAGRAGRRPAACRSG